MFKSPIIFGSINKKFLLPFLLALGQIVYNLFYKYYPEKKNDMVIHFFMVSFGQMLIKLVPYIFKFYNKEEEKEKILHRKKCIHYFLIIFLFLIDLILNLGLKIVEINLNNGDSSFTQSNLFPPTDFIIMSIEMIFLVFISICLLKYKYYKHHIISIIIFLIIGIICELILKDDGEINGSFFLIESIKILTAASSSIYCCYQKYMMEKLFYPYWIVAFIPGLVGLIIECLILIFVLSDPKREKSSIQIVSDFYLFYQQSDVGLLIGKILFDFIMHAIMCPLAILVIYHFTPDYILIILQLTRISENLIDVSADKLYCIIFYIIQFIALMIHLEILELNFCGLNKYTKRRIGLRGIDDINFEGRDSTSSFDNIGINDDYYVMKRDDPENHTEMQDNFIQ